MKPKKIFLFSLFFGIIGGVISYFVISSLIHPSENELIKDFYLTENAVHVSPHSLRGKMDKGQNDFALVDLRSSEEYEKEHIIGAINIPAYKDKYTSAYGDVERIVGEFSKLPKNKEIIVYCYSTPCMTGRKVGKMLAEKGIYAKHLGIGWNEWRYSWNSWNHEHEWSTTNVNDYIAKGKEPGIPKQKKSSSVCSVGDFGC